MGKFILKRLGQMVLVLLAVSVIIFALVRITPSDPVASMTQGKSVSEETKQELREHYHLDKSAPEQYIIWVTGIFKGDLGESYQYKQSVGFLIGERIGTTMTLVLLSGVLAILIAIPVGVISAVKMNTWIDKLLSVITLIFVASPVFLTALVLMLVFALKLRWFPAIYQGNGLKEMILPAIALAMNMVALTSRITRTSMIEQLNSDYIRTATAKGIPRRRVIITYALKNAMIPIITVTSIQVGSMLVGAVLVESVFAMGGLGDLLIKGIKAADYPVVQGVTLLMVFVFLCAVTRSQSFGCVMPFAMGLLYDLLSGGVVGAMSFALTLFSYVGARVFAAMENDTLFMPIAVMSAGMLLTELVYGIFLLATGYNASFIDALIFRALPCAIYDSVIAFILYPLASRFFSSGGPASPIVATQLR